MQNTQATMCERFGADFHPSEPDLKLGVALGTLGQRPINGLRHPAKGDTSGWYVWAGGEPSAAADFFQPVHISHLDGILPTIVPYLGRPAGWRFQVAPGHEDVWFDADLLNVS